MATVPPPTKTEFTVTDAAEMFNRTTARIRQICITHDIGKNILGKIRILNRRDIAKIRRIIEQKGYNMPDDDFYEKVS